METAQFLLYLTVFACPWFRVEWGGPSRPMPTQTIHTIHLYSIQPAYLNNLNCSIPPPSCPAFTVPPDLRTQTLQRGIGYIVSYSGIYFERENMFWRGGMAAWEKN